MFFQNFLMLSDFWFFPRKPNHFPPHYYTFPTRQFLAASPSKCLRYKIGKTEKFFRFKGFFDITQIFHSETVDRSMH